MGQHLRRYRQRLGMTAVDMADVLHVSERQYRRIEAGTASIRVSHLVYLARAHNVRAVLAVMGLG